MIVGIDLGTTNSLIGTIDSGFPVLIPGINGKRLTPSAVGFPKDGEPVVGEEALALRTDAPQRVVTSVKRLMGLRAGEPLDPRPVFPVTGRPGEPVRIVIDDRQYLPEEIATLILKKLRDDARRNLGADVDRAVITVPAYFNDGQRAATKRAGEAAGFTVERIIGEPTAAALAYGLDRLAEKSLVAVFDLGGGTFDVSILELTEGFFEVLATNGNTRLGGDDLDHALAREWNVVPSIAEAIKKRLTDHQQTEFLDRTYDRDDLDRICRPILEQTRRHCVRALSDAEISPADLTAVVLVGGATRMPLVRSLITEFFGREPDVSQNPDEAVALGATIQAGILNGEVSNVTLLDVTPLSLGIETFGGLMNVLIPRNTTIPCKAGEMFTNAASGQRTMRVSVLQGEREMARDNWRLGEFDVAFEPAPRGRARVGIQFEIDADGILRVLARDTATGRDSTVELQSAVEVSDEAVEKMLGDSLEHAFEDMDERIFTEAKIKAEEMLPAVRLALDQVGHDLPAAEIDLINQKCEAVQSSISSRSASRLRTSTAELDAATQSLATLLLERTIGTSNRP
jgi:molecular chaperone DnaK